METFAKFIVESANSESDAKGKYHELQVGHYLSSGKLQHTREKGYGPKEIKQGIKDVSTPEQVKHMDTHAKAAAGAIKDHLAKTHKGHEISAVHWSSQASDHEKITGHKDPNSTADLIVTMKHPKTGKEHHVGVSLKYGNSKAANLKNPGMKTLEGHAGSNLKQFADEHAATVAKHGIKSHADFKTFRDSKDPKRQKIAQKIMKSSVDSRQKMAHAYTKDMQAKYKGNEEDLKNHIKGMIAPKTHLQEIRVQTTTHGDGHAEAPHITNHDHIHKALDHYKDIHVGDHKGGTSMTVYGTHKKSGKKKVLFTTMFHGGGRPSQAGAVGVVKAPFLTGKDKHD